MSTKSLVGLYLPVDLADEVRQRADAAGLPYSALYELTIRFGLARLNDDALRKYAAKRESTRGRNGGGMAKNERAALGALERLTVRPAFRLELEDIADEAGLPRREAFRAMQALKARGLVRAWSVSEELDRWGRPARSVWQLEPLPEWAGKPYAPGEG